MFSKPWTCFGKLCELAPNMFGATDNVSLASQQADLDPKSLTPIAGTVLLEGLHLVDAEQFYRILALLTVGSSSYCNSKSLGARYQSPSYDDMMHLEHF